MAVKPIPNDYHTVTPYLTVRGAAQVVEFLKEAFGAEERFRMNGSDGTVAHAEMRVGDSMVMVGEASEKWPPMPASLYVYVPDADSIYHRAIEAGAVSVMEPADQFYGDRHGGVRDSAGNVWWIATHKEDVSPEEIERRARLAMAKG
ncbi:MAG TPA: VOC family protein [Bryobacteraceae bacterium]|nr:VOC family protein [Bryobacteraceae bacterium]